VGEAIAGVLSQFKRKEQEVLLLRWGLHATSLNNKKSSYKQVAQMTRTSGEKIRKVERQASDLFQRGRSAYDPDDVIKQMAGPSAWEGERQGGVSSLW
jgi:DNA-directed RNA polymerase sigma subunit (sigma70/sigma32)